MTNETTELEPVELPTNEIAEEIHDRDVDVDNPEEFAEEIEEVWKEASGAHVKDMMRDGAVERHGDEIHAYSHYEFKLIIETVDDKLTVDDVNSINHAMRAVFAERYPDDTTHVLKEVDN
jgi:hypothetical protein